MNVLSNEWLFQTKTPTPVCLGTGLIALDILIDENDESLSYTVGGSCGNVLTILSYLGWNSYPIAYLGRDEAAELAVKDFVKWGVKDSFVDLGRESGTPIVIERLEHSDGLTTHRFEFTCPNCDSPLPRNRPIPFERASQLLKECLPHRYSISIDRQSLHLQ